MADKIEQKVIEAAKAVYGVKTDKEAREAVIAEWGKQGLRGYGKFTGGVFPEHSVHIARLDELGIYESDVEAAKQAAKDGVKLIPYREQPKKGMCRCVRFVDTKANRRALNIR
jgi:hypothetical protein